MARRIKQGYRQIPQKTKDVMSQGSIAVNPAYNRLNTSHCEVLTPTNKIRSMAKAEGQRNRVPIILSPKTKTNRYANAATNYTADLTTKKIKIEVRLHPVLKYYPPEYVKNVLGHELDHVKAIRKTTDNQSWWERQRKISKKTGEKSRRIG